MNQNDTHEGDLCTQSTGSSARAQEVNNRAQASTVPTCDFFKTARIRTGKCAPIQAQLWVTVRTAALTCTARDPDWATCIDGLHVLVTSAGHKEPNARQCVPVHSVPRARTASPHAHLSSKEGGAEVSWEAGRCTAGCEQDRSDLGIEPVTCGNLHTHLSSCTSLNDTLPALPDPQCWMSQSYGSIGVADGSRTAGVPSGTGKATAYNLSLVSGSGRSLYDVWAGQQTRPVCLALPSMTNLHLSR